jgi:hypothetical protein
MALTKAFGLGLNAWGDAIHGRHQGLTQSRLHLHLLKKNKNMKYKLIFICLCLLNMLGLSAQQAPQFSQAELLSDGQTYATKLYANRYLDKITLALEQPEPEILVVLSEDNILPHSEDSAQNMLNYYNRYQAGTYQLLDANFASIGFPIGSGQLAQIKYILKSKQLKAQGQKISLESHYNLWDPNPKVGPLPVRYYSLMYIIAFALGIYIMRYIYQRQCLKNQNSSFCWL